MDIAKLAAVMERYGVTAETLVDPPAQLEEDVRCLIQRLYATGKAGSAEDIIRYLFQLNCYFAAKCCPAQSRDLVLHLLDEELASQAPGGNRPWNLVLAMYYLGEYDRAGAFIKAYTPRKKDPTVIRFYEKILSIGLPNVEDQVYLLCHCYQASVLFEPFSNLALINQWHCTIDPDAPYIGAFDQMLVGLLTQRQYRPLLNLLKILGSNREEAREIFLRHCGAGDFSQLRYQLRLPYAQKLGRIKINEYLIYLELELNPAPNRHQSLFKWISRKDFIQPSNLKCWLEWYLAVDEYIQCGTMDVLSALSQNEAATTLFKPYLHPGGQPLYFEKLVAALDKCIQSPSKRLPFLRKLARIHGYNLFADPPQSDACSFYAQFFPDFHKRYLNDPVYNTRTLNLLRRAAQSELPAATLREIYANTHLKTMLTFDKFCAEMPYDLSALQAAQDAYSRWRKFCALTAPATKAAPATFVLEENSMSPSRFQHPRGTAFRLAPGSYQLTAVSVGTKGAPIGIQVFRFALSQGEAPNPSPKDKLVRAYQNQRSFRITLEEDQYIMLLSPNSRYEITPAAAPKPATSGV